MIRKILKLRNIGLLQNAVQDGAVELSKVTAIYAENGRGKSTLASIMRSCQLGDAGRLNARKTIDVDNSPEFDFLLNEGSHIEFRDGVWNGPKPNIVVFDSEFVEQNVYSGFEIRPDQRQSLLEFALGDETVQLKQLVDQLTQDIASQTTKLTQAEKALSGYAAPYNTSEFISLPEVPNSQQQIDDLNKKLEAAKNAQALIRRADPLQAAIIEFDFEYAFSLFQRQIKDLEEQAENIVKSHISNYATGFEDWIGQGVEHINSDNCPFCGQNLSDLDLVRAYQSYFNKAYNDLKNDVSLLETKINRDLANVRITNIISTLDTNSARIEAWKDKIEMETPTLNQDSLHESLTQLREKMLFLVSTKHLSPLNSIGSDSDFEFVITKITQINELINNYNSEIEAVVNKISEFKKEMVADDITSLEHDISKLKASQRRQDTDVITLVSDYQSAYEEKTRLDREKTDLRTQLDTLMNSTLNEYQTSINEYLELFGAEFAIEKLKPNYSGSGRPRTDFGLVLRNKSVKLGSRTDLATCHSFAATLSEADKRTLAFAFFISRLKADPNISNTIVVFDDPVSSLDRNRRFHSVELIVSLARECKQLLVLSHDAYFVRDFQETLEHSYLDPITVKVLNLKRVQNDYSAFSPCNIDDICASDYYRHHQLVVDYVNGESTVADIRDIAKAIRPLLEGYYHRRFPGIIPRNRMFGEIIGLASSATSQDPLVYLQPSLQELRAVNNYTSQFHHDTNPGCENVHIVDSELRSFAKRALKLIYSS